jgi:hypothetical protein
LTVLFLGICAGSLLTSVTTSATMGSVVERRALALAAIESDLELARSLARTGSLGAGTTNGALSLPGSVTANRSRTVVAHATLANVLRVTSSVTYTEPTLRTARADTISITTFVRSPE